MPSLPPTVEDCCESPSLTWSRVEQTETGVLRACYVCHQCGYWRSLRWLDDTDYYVVENQCVLPNTTRWRRPPRCFEFPPAMGWLELRRRYYFRQAHMPTSDCH